MAVPKRKVSRSRRDQRRAHDTLQPSNAVECDNCGELKLPHHVCKACGSYSGRDVKEPEGGI